MPSLWRVLKVWVSWSYNPSCPKFKKKCKPWVNGKSMWYKKECKKIQVQRAVNVHTVPEQFYFPTWMVSERWARSERTLRARWTVNAWWTICECFLNAGWTIYSELLSSYPYIVFVGNQEKIANKLHVQCCYCESWQNNRILSYILYPTSCAASNL